MIDASACAAAFTERVRRSRTLRYQLRLKRAFDVAASLALLIASAPLLGAAAVAVVTESPGPALFTGKRYGYRAELFACYKFRSMHVDGDAVLRANGLNDRGPDGRLLLFENDPRITRVGAFLRKTSIDELPQLVHVLRGEMSLVGPRPLAPYMLDGYPALRAARGVVRPGITGLWQVRRRMKNASVLDMIDDDCEYVATYSFARDLVILLRTIPRVLLPTRAHDAS